MNRNLKPFDLSLVDSIQGWLAPGQEEWLYRKARAMPDGSVILEIGSHIGRSTACLGLGCSGQSKRLICFDTWDDYEADQRPRFTRFIENMERLGLANIIEAIRGDSATELNKLKGYLSTLNISLVFIDGDHRYEHVKMDYEAVRSVVKPGCWIAMHDVDPTSTDHHNGSGAVWNEFKHELKNIEHWNNLYCGQLT